MELFLATENLNKKKEFEAMLQVKSNNRFHLQHLSDLPDFQKKQYNPIESATTFIGNATLKAEALFQIINKPVIAEDSGLCVPALGGAPGIYSNRYADTDPKRIQRLLQEMSHLQSLDRSAYFITCICYMDSLYNKTFFIGRSYGTILNEAKGTSGFGYDPIFYSTAIYKSFAEASLIEKNSVSHRNKAFTLLLDYLTGNKNT